VNNFSWTLPATATDLITVNPYVDQVLNVFTLSRGKLGQHSVSLTNAISFNGGDPVNAYSSSLTYTFAIDVVDPCVTTVLNTVNPVSISNVSVVNGIVTPHTITFAGLTDSVG
jgi:hypothetical protein